MTDSELKQLAVDIAEGKVFGSWMVKQTDLLPMIFLPLSFGGAEKLKDIEVWSLFEYSEKALGNQIKGHPVFPSFKYLTKDDCEKLNPMLEKLKLMKQEFLNGSLFSN